MESSIPELLLAGGRLMFIGMTIVFLFLALLVGVIHVTSRLIGRYSPEEPVALKPVSAVVARSTGGEDEAEIVAAITAAIHRYQNK
ncbi:OadG family protein [Methylococcus capsulatus]|jgi:oxaloacetate decarboxylase gamma subunit|uniref:Probable oxaloacetate decarboxylase gamma chain n=1 Tax=Methylococcus capsulatus (strain ATCC 33009 / NCIMB 11132 / Bath) TaxID=243233 RepID=Q604Q7_METCA|nr:OadG family protein [Methylococcus capsulatus]AAU91399.1 oxaloacetate decarboxylase, gamma subunit [Methylococcus capsulatus str. Bath]QXP86948.1 OadG family protein [Methylococcus capsulatus]QXP93372.1 OadG family protein [Methylococcus capsulatus]UQN11930.1 OadG family protein [Methylococcus capsulatus]